MTAGAPQHLASGPSVINPPADPLVVLSPEEREAIRLAHRRRRLSMKTVARRLGVCPHMLARYRCGERKPRRSLLDLWWKELS
jgi:predicted DNA-binding protein (UPF0251 family)